MFQLFLLCHCVCRVRIDSHSHFSQFTHFHMCLVLMVPVIHVYAFVSSRGCEKMPHKHTNPLSRRPGNRNHCYLCTDLQFFFNLHSMQISLFHLLLNSLYCAALNFLHDEFYVCGISNPFIIFSFFCIFMLSFAFAQRFYRNEILK